MEPKFFENPAELREWFIANHAEAVELWVGYYKKDSGKASITWPESVDEALCFGWIDGVRYSVDEISYKIRFSPRRQRSTWSAVNIRRAQELIEAGLMEPAGLAAFEQRQENRSGIYSYEQRSENLPEPYSEKLQGNLASWEFFQSQSASYRKAVYWWIVSAKKEETRQKRLDELIEACAQGRILPQFLRR